jgi:hypothetical protein
MGCEYLAEMVEYCTFFFSWLTSNRCNEDLEGLGFVSLRQSRCGFNPQVRTSNTAPNNQDLCKPAGENDTGVIGRWKSRSISVIWPNFNKLRVNRQA